ncbi:MAG: hypothetical protein JWP26_996 [Devosia sp.]|nr:hypothetical protein [Devosia sp.]MDB5586026.1 hypothetical protein [Devosia sp.]
MRSRIITALFLSPSGRGRPAGPDEGESIRKLKRLGLSTTPPHPALRATFSPMGRRIRAICAGLSPQGEVKGDNHVP